MSNVADFTTQVMQSQIATISTGQTESDAVNIYGTTAVGVIVPAGFTGSSLSFLVTNDLIDKVNPPVYVPLYDPSGNLLLVVVAATPYGSRLNPADFFPWSSLKVVSDTPQVADLQLKIITRVI
jgi:hypothetical protein